MKVSQVKELFRLLTEEYFDGATVTFTRQSRVAKPDIPLVSLTPGNVTRPQNAVYCMTESGEVVGSYSSRLGMTVDLFTKGAPVKDDETGMVVAYENTAMDDILGFVDFLNSPYVVEWSDKNDISVVLDGDAQDLTGIVNDNNYEFRSRVTVGLYFTQYAVEAAAVLSEASIESDTGIFNPVFVPTSSGGGSEDLAGLRVSYFDEVEIEEESVNE